MSVQLDPLEHTFAPIPVIDISPFFEGSQEDRMQVAQAVNDACEGIGFILVTGHGVPQPIIDRFMDVSRRFFQLPLEQKREAASPLNTRYVGYAAPGKGPGDQPSERQSFNVFRFDTPEEAIAQGYPEYCGSTMFPAVWPREPEGFREAWRAYFEEMEAFARRLMSIFEVGLGLPAGWFDYAITHDQSTQAANYYSYDLEPNDSGPYRFKAHVDGSIVTILYQDDGPGCLQLHQRGKGWRDVMAIEGSFVVNLGELMARWTNDRYVATPHRVAHPDDPNEQRTRLSAPFFLKPNHDAVIAPIPDLIAPGDKPHYEPVQGGPWVAKSQSDAQSGYDSQARFEELAAANPIYR